MKITEIKIYECLKAKINFMKFYFPDYEIYKFNLKTINNSSLENRSKICSHYIDNVAESKFKFDDKAELENIVVIKKIVPFFLNIPKRSINMLRCPVTYKSTRSSRMKQTDIFIVPVEYTDVKKETYVFIFKNAKNDTKYNTVKLLSLSRIL